MYLHFYLLIEKGLNAVEYFLELIGRLLQTLMKYTKLRMISRQTQWYAFHSRICCDTCDRFNRISNSTKTKVFLNHILDAHMILTFLNFPVDINDAALYTIKNLDH